MSKFNGVANNLLLLADHIEEHCPTTAQGCRDGAATIAEMQETIRIIQEAYDNSVVSLDARDDEIDTLQAENAKLRNIAETALKLRGRLKEVGIDTPWLDGALQEAGYNV